MASSWFRRLLKGALIYTAIIVVTLVIVDLLCIALGLFPPATNPGDPDLGWRPATATGKMAIGKCTEFSTGEQVIYQRNEDGVRTSLSREQVLADTGTLRVGISGDSQTDLCSTNEQLPGGVMQAELTAKGRPTTALTYGAGRYSPLQAYLAYKKVLLPYRPGVFILQVYTGNDLYDILRADDRPHFEATDSGYHIAQPIWYTLDDPNAHPKSRVLYALRLLGDRTGVRQLALRLTELRRLGHEYGASIFGIFSYMQDLWKAREPSVGYSDAFSAQMLNQQLFFQHFPSAKEESIRRMKALMEMMRRENPGVTFVMSPIPSYELVGEQPVDSSLVATLKRLPISYEEGQQQEGGLYEQLRQLAKDEGWIFSDNLAALRQYEGGSGRLYNNFDYHLLPGASAAVGRAQAAALLAGLPR